MIDPAFELFDLCDRDGKPTGERKARSLVHRDGDWHRSFHCWVVTMVNGAPAIVLQKRSALKETWAGLWDVSVAGHYSAGEGIEGGLREMQEELGLEVTAEELIQTGQRREEVRYDNGVIEREIQDVYFLLRDVGLDGMRSDVAEVSAVTIVPAALLEGLVVGDPSSAEVPGGPVLADGRIGIGTLLIATAELVPRSDGYYAKATRAAIELASGEPAARQPLWW